MKQVLAIVGPTASGKTALAIALAERLHTEIISADSMQFYRHMEIGTGAPTTEELARAKHHFIGFLDPWEEFTAGMFEQVAREQVARLNADGKTAVAVGGSGLYIGALIDGLFPGPGKDEDIRARLQQEAEENGVPALFERLCELDPDYANIIQCNDLRRIARALEVHELTGRALSELHQEHRAESESLDAIQVLIDWPRDQLYDRINRRVDHMLSIGLLDEVQWLIDNGYAEHVDRLKSLGYREMAAYLRGETSLEEATELMKRNSRRYAKRQLTWYRADARVQWIAPGDRSAEEVAEVVLTESGLLPD